MSSSDEMDVPSNQVGTDTVEAHTTVVRQGCGGATPAGLSFKRSYGIVCCRRSELGVLEALCIRKKYTYAFADFIHGKYTSATSPIIQKYLNNMTAEEKYALLSMDFEQIYARVWQKNDLFHMQKHRAKFMNTFGSSPHATAHLMRMISKSLQYIAEWELPKGHREEGGAAPACSRAKPSDTVGGLRGPQALFRESELDCAIREFREETNMTPLQYTIVPNCVLKHDFIVSRVKYMYTFYLAIVKDDCNTTPVLDLCGPQGSEVAEISWCDIGALRDSRILPVAKRAFEYVKKHALC